LIEHSALEIRWENHKQNGQFNQSNRGDVKHET
jgi:hypothetical protein